MLEYLVACLDAGDYRIRMNALCVMDILVKEHPEVVRPYVPKLASMTGEEHRAVSNYASITLMHVARSDPASIPRDAVSKFMERLGSNDDFQKMDAMVMLEVLAEKDPSTASQYRERLKEYGTAPKVNAMIKGRALRLLAKLEKGA